MDEPLLVISGLSGRYLTDGVSVDVCIFRLLDEREWSLDAYLEGGDCVAWTETFRTESGALAEFFGVAANEGASMFLAHAHA